MCVVLYAIQEGRASGFLCRADYHPRQMKRSAVKSGPHAHSLVELNLLRDKRQARQLNLGGNRRINCEDGDGHGRRVSFNSRTCQMEIGDALPKLDAYRAFFAAAAVVGLVYDIRSRENLEPE